MANVNKLQDANGNEYNLQDTISGYQNATQVNTAVTSYHDSTKYDASNPSGYQTSAQVQNAITSGISGKQDTLVSGTNIKTINNNSLLGSGNISISGGHTWATSYGSVSATTPSVVIKEYVSGASGYRIWATGYCEQWGEIPKSTSSASFVKTFANTNYTILISCPDDNSSSNALIGEIGGVRSTTGFTTRSISSSKRCWRVFGYLASGQY